MYPYLRRIIFFLFFIFLVPRLFAATFTVTSNADRGPGSLREAIELSTANGATVTDYIYFNLPATTVADRTILLTEDLPALPGNLVIDGSTQPGAKFGVSGAKVVIGTAANFSAGRWYALTIDGVEHVEIYGLFLQCGGWGLEGYAIYVNDATNITIGAEGKGNLIHGFYQGIYQDRGLVTGITIQGNLLGIDANGETNVAGNGESLRLFKASGVTVGGNTAGKGNVFGSPAMIDCNRGGPIVV